MKSCHSLFLAVVLLCLGFSLRVSSTPEFYGVYFPNLSPPFTINPLNFSSGNFGPAAFSTPNLQDVFCFQSTLDSSRNIIYLPLAVAPYSSIISGLAFSPSSSSFKQVFNLPTLSYIVAAQYDPISNQLFLLASPIPISSPSSSSAAPSITFVFASVALNSTSSYLNTLITLPESSTPYIFGEGTMASVFDPSSRIFGYSSCASCFDPNTTTAYTSINVDTLTVTNHPVSPLYAAYALALDPTEPNTAYGVLSLNLTVKGPYTAFGRVDVRTGEATVIQEWDPSLNIAFVPGGTAWIDENYVYTSLGNGILPPIALAVIEKSTGNISHTAFVGGIDLPGQPLSYFAFSS